MAEPIMYRNAKIERIKGGFAVEDVDEGVSMAIADETVRQLAGRLASEGVREAGAEGVHLDGTGKPVPMVAVHTQGGGRPRHIMRAEDIAYEWHAQGLSGHRLYRAGGNFIAGNVGTHPKHFVFVSDAEAAAWWAEHCPKKPMPGLLRDGAMYTTT